MRSLRIALRTLKSYKLYNTINILGLVMSLACTIALSRYIYREFTVDGFNENIDRVYAEVLESIGEKSRLSHFDNPNNEVGFIDPKNNPTVKAMSVYVPLPNDYIKYNNRKYLNLTFAVDSMFLPITAYPLAKGDINSLFTSPNDVVLTAEFAKKVFGDEDPMGKTLFYSQDRPLTVKGVLAADAKKRFLKYDVLISISLDKRWMRMPQSLILLHEGTSIDDLNSEHSKYTKYRYSNDKSVRSQFVSYKSLYFDETINWDYNLELFNKGDYNSLFMLIVVAVVVFLIGIFNFVNIYTVMLLKRGKEFGLKKVFGVGATSILWQLIVENMLLVFISTAFGWLLVVVAKDFLEVSLNIPQVSHLKFDVVLTLSLLILVPVITSLYPYLKYKKEASVSMQKMPTSKSTSLIRSLLLMLQYVVSISMIIFSLYFVKQLDFMLNADLGFNSSNVVEAKFFTDEYTNIISNREKIKDQAKVVGQRLDQSPAVGSWYFGTKIDDGAGDCKIKRLGGEFKDVKLYYIGSALASIYNLYAINGRMPVDSIDNRDDKLYNMWINESAAKLFDVKDLDTTLLQTNERLWWSYDTDRNYNPPHSITGVIKDYKISHLRYSISPAIYMFDSQDPSEHLMVRFEKGKEREGVELLKELYSEFVGDGDLKYNFLTDRLTSKYEDDKRVSTVLITFAIIALVISSLGLFSLSLYDIERRYREIALRRVCGAQSFQIIQMFLAKYMRQLLVSFVVASVLSYALINIYMQDFAERTSLSWWIFVVAALVTALISLITLVWQTKKAADTNPAIIMKTE